MLYDSVVLKAGRGRRSRYRHSGALGLLWRKINVSRLVTNSFVLFLCILCKITARKVQTYQTQ